MDRRSVSSGRRRGRGSSQVSIDHAQFDNSAIDWSVTPAIRVTERCLEGGHLYYLVSRPGENRIWHSAHFEADRATGEWASFRRFEMEQADKIAEWQQRETFRLEGLDETQITHHIKMLRQQHDGNKQTQASTALALPNPPAAASSTQPIVKEDGIDMTAQPAVAVSPSNSSAPISALVNDSSMKSMQEIEHFSLQNDPVASSPQLPAASDTEIKPPPMNEVTSHPLHYLPASSPPASDSISASTSAAVPSSDLTYLDGGPPPVPAPVPPPTMLTPQRSIPPAALFSPDGPETLPIPQPQLPVEFDVALSAKSSPFEDEEQGDLDEDEYGDIDDDDDDGDFSMGGFDPDHDISAQLAHKPSDTPEQPEPAQLPASSTNNPAHSTIPFTPSSLEHHEAKENVRMVDPMDEEMPQLESVRPIFESSPLLPPSPSTTLPPILPAANPFPDTTEEKNSHQALESAPIVPLSATVLPLISSTSALLPCQICFSSSLPTWCISPLSQSDASTLLDCRTCGTRVHAGCYGVSVLPYLGSSWWCAVCDRSGHQRHELPNGLAAQENQGREAERLEAQRRGPKALEMFDEEVCPQHQHCYDAREVKCLVCTQKGGPMLPLSFEFNYVHILCAQHLPSRLIPYWPAPPWHWLYFLTLTTKETTRGKQGIICSLCHQVRFSYCTTCAEPGCGERFHAMCARQHGCQFHVKMLDGYMPLHSVYCIRHSPNRTMPTLSTIDAKVEEEKPQAPTVSNQPPSIRASLDAESEEGTPLRRRQRKKKKIAHDDESDGDDDNQPLTMLAKSPPPPTSSVSSSLSPPSAARSSRKRRHSPTTLDSEDEPLNPTRSISDSTRAALSSTAAEKKEPKKMSTRTARTAKETPPSDSEYSDSPSLSYSSASSSSSSDSSTPPRRHNHRRQQGRYDLRELSSDESSDFSHPSDEDEEDDEEDVEHPGEKAKQRPKTRSSKSDATPLDVTNLVDVLYKFNIMTQVARLICTTSDMEVKLMLAEYLFGTLNRRSLSFSLPLIRSSRNIERVVFWRWYQRHVDEFPVLESITRWITGNAFFKIDLSTNEVREAPPQDPVHAYIALMQSIIAGLANTSRFWLTSASMARRDTHPYIGLPDDQALALQQLNRSHERDLILAVERLISPQGPSDGGILRGKGRKLISLLQSDVSGNLKVGEAQAETLAANLTLKYDDGPVNVPSMEPLTDEEYSREYAKWTNHRTIAEEHPNHKRAYIDLARAQQLTILCMRGTPFQRALYFKSNKVLAKKKGKNQPTNAKSGEIDTTGVNSKPSDKSMVAKEREQRSEERWKKRFAIPPASLPSSTSTSSSSSVSAPLIGTPRQHRFQYFEPPPLYDWNALTKENVAQLRMEQSKRENKIFNSLNKQQRKIFNKEKNKWEFQNGLCAQRRESRREKKAKRGLQLQRNLIPPSESTAPTYPPSYPPPTSFDYVATRQPTSALAMAFPKEFTSTSDTNHQQMHQPPSNNAFPLHAVSQFHPPQPMPVYQPSPQPIPMVSPVAFAPTYAPQPTSLFDDMPPLER